MKHGMVEATHSPEKVKKYYSWRASNYDAGAGFEKPHHEETLTLARIGRGSSVLDAACGTGAATVALAEAVGEAGEVDAIDLTEAMLGKAREKIGRAGLSSRVRFRQGSVLALPYADQSFDAVYNGYMFDLLPIDDFPAVLSELLRVLKPGGRLVLVNMSKADERKTGFEKAYEKGWAVMPCRPVLMKPFVEEAGFVDVERVYRRNKGLILSRLWGAEIVTARRSSDGRKADQVNR